jgi:hypothetical protein
MARNDVGKAQECLRIAKTNMDTSDAARSCSPEQVANVLAAGQLYATLALIEVLQDLRRR